MATRRRHTPDQIIRKLAEGNKLLAGGAELDEVCRHLQIAESTWHRWLAQYGGMKANDAKRLKELETENTTLKKLLAEAELDKAMLKELAEENRRPRTVAAVPSKDCRCGSGSPSVRRVRSSVSTARPSVSFHQSHQATSRPCGRSCDPSPRSGPAGAGVAPPRHFVERPLRSTTSSGAGLA